MSEQLDVENGAAIGRVTCGWKRPELSLDQVCRFWRDVHSPAISRRAGIYEYRHFQFAPVQADVIRAAAGVQTQAPETEQLMWLSDVRYRDQAALDAFGASPGPEEKALILADIEMIVDKSTTYLVLGDGGRTLVDRTEAAPAGPAKMPTFALFFRRKGSEAEFRAHLGELAAAWARLPGVARLRLSLFETPDMEAERRAGYPVKTHPVAMQYQAWIDLSLDDEADAAGLSAEALTPDFAAHVAAVHAYPVRAVYAFVYRERPTLIGLRGYAAHEAISALGGVQHKAPALLRWMYGDVVKEGPAA